MIEQSSPRLQQTFTPPIPLPNLTFRLAQATDLPALQKNCYPETDWRQFQDHYGYLLKWQENGRCAVLVAETAATHVYQTDSLIPDLPNPVTNSPLIIGSGQLIRRLDKTAEIAELAVHINYRNQGIGTAIIHILTQIALEKKTSMLEIGVAVENQAALRLYHRLGFGRDRLVCLPDAQEAIILRKSLTPTAKKQRGGRL